MKTSYFTLGQNHAHAFNGHTLDKNCVVKITSENPRKQMFDFFGTNWAFEYDDKPNMVYFPRGIYDLTNNEWEPNDAF